MDLPKKNIPKSAFTEPGVLEASPAAQAPSAEELNLLIKKFAPLLCFHPEEECLPVKVEWYLQRAWLVNAATRTREPADTANLPTATEKSGTFHLEPKEGISMRQGKISIRTYVHAKARETYTDLQYWFFCAQTNPASAYVKWLIGDIKGHESEIPLSPLGSCNGNWERVTLRISNASHRIQQVFFPGDKAWVSAEHLKMQDEQVMIFASRNGCTFYSQPGLHSTEKVRFHLFSSELEFSMRHETVSGKQMNFSGSCELISADYLDSEKPAEPAWLNFQGHWGQPHPDYLNASTIRRMVLSTFGKTLEFLLSRDILDKLVNHLQSYFASECQLKSLAPKSRKCWNGEETD